MANPPRFLARALALAVLACAPARAYDVTLDFEAAGQFDAHFTRTFFDADDFLGHATQTTSAGNGVVAYDDRTFGIFFQYPSWSIFTFNPSAGTPGWPRVSNRSTFALTSPLRVSADLKVPAAAAGTVFGVEFSDPNDVEKTRTVRAQITVNAETQSVDFRRVTAIPGEGTTSLGTAIKLSTALQPGAADFTRVTVVLDATATPRTLTLQVAGGEPVVQALPADLLDWPRTLVSIAFFDPDIQRTVNKVSYSGIGPTLLDNFSVAAGSSPAPAPAPVAAVPDIPTDPAPRAGVNLLTVNPSFEDSEAQTLSGAWTLRGWTGNNPDTARRHLVQEGGSPEGGARRITIERRGTLATAASARAAIAPGHRYELVFDLRTFNRVANVRLGTMVNLNFFDASGTLLKTVWGPDWKPWVQSDGEQPWTTYRITGVAPAGAVLAGVGIECRGGRGEFGGADGDGRSIDLDNVRLTRLAEARDLIAVRRAPRLIEPGRVAMLRVHTAAPAHRDLSARLLNAAGVPVAAGGFTVPAGRGLHTVEVEVPANLPDGSYRWELRLLPRGGGAPAATRTLDPVPLDTVVKTSTINTTDFAADDPWVVYQGRIEALVGGRRKLHWYGSEARVRFSGTSLTLLGSCENNGYGGANPTYIHVVIDDNEAGAIPRRLESLNENGSAVFRLVSGLPDGIHTARIFKSDESVDGILRIDRFRVDEGRGLLRPEPLSERRIEIYGDSVTSGSATLPTYLGFAPRLGRELDADVRIISKGGAGLGGSFGVEVITRLWDNLKFLNAFKASAGTKWDFTQWRPNIVMIAAGHNDLFRAPSIFPQKYAEFVAGLRGVYGPAVPIFATNTTISAPEAFFEEALAPLLASDPKLFWSFQRYPTPGSRGHPNNLAHGWMVDGNTRQFSYAERVEEIMGWGLD
jgi:lysophospholipase L1-like esterase